MTNRGNFVKDDEMTNPLVRDDFTDKMRRYVIGRRSGAPVRIASERDLASIHDVSRPIVRRAIKTLVSEGLLFQKQGSGTYITPTSRIRRVQVLKARGIKPNDPFYNEFLAEMTHYASDTDIQVEIIREGSREMSSGDDAPLIIVGLVEKNVVDDAVANGRLVLSTQDYPDSFNFTQVLFDDYRIGIKAMQILSEYGHDTVVQLCGPPSFPSAEERSRGFSNAAQRYGIKIENLVGKMNWRSGYELAESVISFLRSDDPPTAIFAANDWMALGLMQRLAEEQIAVPADVSVIGCDDIHLATEVSPTLSTFRWDMAYIVAELFAVLDSQQSVAGPITHKRVLLSALFVKRDSLARR